VPHEERPPGRRPPDPIDQEEITVNAATPTGSTSGTAVAEEPSPAGVERLFVVDRASVVTDVRLDDAEAA
jgi:hypothetical protein